MSQQEIDYVQIQIKLVFSLQLINYFDVIKLYHIFPLIKYIIKIYMLKCQLNLNIFFSIKFDLQTKLNF